MLTLYLYSNTADPDCAAFPASIDVVLEAGGLQVSGQEENFVISPVTLLNVSCVGESQAESSKCTQTVRSASSAHFTIRRRGEDATLYSSGLTAIVVENYRYSDCHQNVRLIVDYGATSGRPGACIEVDPELCRLPTDSLSGFTAEMFFSDNAGISRYIPIRPLDSAAAEADPNAFSLPYDSTKHNRFCWYLSDMVTKEEKEEGREILKQALIAPYKSARLRLRSTSRGAGSVTTVTIPSVVGNYYSANYRNCFQDTKLIVYQTRLAVQVTLKPNAARNCIPASTTEQRLILSIYSSMDPEESRFRFSAEREDKMFDFSHTQLYYVYCDKQSDPQACTYAAQSLLNTDPKTVVLYGQFIIAYYDAGEFVDAAVANINSVVQSCFIEASLSIYSNYVCYDTVPSWKDSCPINEPISRELTLELLQNNGEDFEYYDIEEVAFFRKTDVFTGQTMRECFTCSEDYEDKSYQDKPTNCKAQLNKFYRLTKRHPFAVRLIPSGSNGVEYSTEKVYNQNHLYTYITIGIMLFLLCVATLPPVLVAIHKYKLIGTFADSKRDGGYAIATS